MGGSREESHGEEGIRAASPFLTASELTTILPIAEQQARWWIFPNAEGFANRCVIRRARRVFIERAGTGAVARSGTRALKRQSRPGQAADALLRRPST